MRRLLMVDDEPGIRSLLDKVFSRTGYQVKTAASGFQAVESCGAEDFDVVLSDADMPGMDGHSLIRWLATSCPSTRTMLMSASDLQCDDWPRSAGCKLLRKPFVPTVAVAGMAEVPGGLAG